MEVTTISTEDTKRLAEKIADKIKPGDVLALYGDLGSGKTTFTAFLTKALGFSNRVQSPTFVIMRNYKEDDSGDIKNIYHIDLYRLTTLEEVLDIGLDEIIDEKNSIIIIEWPEIAEEILPDKTKKINFEYVDESSRKISFNE